MKKFLYIMFVVMVMFGLSSCSTIPFMEDDGCAKVIYIAPPEPEPEPEPEPVVVEEEMVVEEIPVTTTTITEKIMFDYNDSALREDQHEIIDTVAGYIAEYPDTIISIIGHASTEGAEDYNLLLSRDRCFSVHVGLTSKGVPPENIKHVIANGETSELK